MLARMTLDPPVDGSVVLKEPNFDMPRWTPRESARELSRESTRQIQRVGLLHLQRGRPTPDELLAYASNYTKGCFSCLTTQYFKEQTSDLSMIGSHSE